MKKGIIVFLVSLGLALATNRASAQANLYDYEGFAYATGTVIDANGGASGGLGGNGWGQFGISANSSYVVTAGSLADPTSTLVTTGNEVSTSVASAGFDGRYFNYMPGQGTAGSNVYYSVLIRPNNLGVQGQTGSGADGGFILQIFGGGGQNGVGVGVQGNNGNWALGEGTITSASSVAAVSNVTAFLAVEVEYGASTDTELLYVNPTPGGAQPGTPSATLTYSIGNQNGLGMNTFNGALVSFDEIRGGTTWASVTPAVLVPEPGTLSLVFGGLICLGYGMRRRARRS
jgi:hypothetical protein